MKKLVENTHKKEKKKKNVSAMLIVTSMTIYDKGIKQDSIL